MALRWTATIEPDRTIEAILGLNTAANFGDFRESLVRFGAPSQNFVYADIDGHIGYQLAGYVPIRSKPKDRGERPVRGDDASGEWIGRIRYDDLPWQLDPPDGWIVTANNAAVDGDYPFFIGREWDPGYRAERIIDLLKDYGTDGLTVSELGKIQFDSSPLRARDMAPLLGGAVPSTDDGRTIAARIAAWDGACGSDSVGCATWNAWEYRVLRDIFDDDLGLSLARDYVGSPLSWVVLGQLMEDPTNRWWDDIATPDITEPEAVIVARAMDEAGAELRTVVGSPDRWSWGRIHTADKLTAPVRLTRSFKDFEAWHNARVVLA